MSEERIIRTMRYMAWQRAKGELESLLETYWSSVSGDYDAMREKVDAFIAEVEGEGLQE